MSIFANIAGIKLVQTKVVVAREYQPAQQSPLNTRVYGSKNTRVQNAIDESADIECHEDTGDYSIEV